VRGRQHRRDASRVDLKNASANPGTQLWLVKDCGHVKAFVTHPQAWQDHVLAFLDGQLK
jgi:hypothetical protein